MQHDQRAAANAHFKRIWPVFAIVLGLAATVAWIAALGWLLLKAARLIL